MHYISYLRQRGGLLVRPIVPISISSAIVRSMALQGVGSMTLHGTLPMAGGYPSWDVALGLGCRLEWRLPYQSHVCQLRCDIPTGSVMPLCLEPSTREGACAVNNEQVCQGCKHAFERADDIGPIHMVHTSTHEMRRSAGYRWTLSATSYGGTLTPTRHAKLPAPAPLTCFASLCFCR